MESDGMSWTQICFVWQKCDTAGSDRFIFWSALLLRHAQASFKPTAENSQSQITCCFVARLFCTYFAVVSGALPPETHLSTSP